MNFKPQELSITLWSFATLGANDIATDVVDMVIDESMKKLHIFKPQHLSNTWWALATLRLKPPDRFINKATKEAIYRLDQFTPQALVNITWALASLGVSHLTLIEALASELSKRLSTLKPQELSITIWSLGELRYYDPDLMDGLAKQVVARISGPKPYQFVPQHFANIMCGFASLDHHHHELVQCICNCVRETSGALLVQPQHISNMLWALLILRPKPVKEDVEVMQVLVDRLTELFIRNGVSLENSEQALEGVNVMSGLYNAQQSHSEDGKKCKSVVDNIGISITSAITSGKDSGLLYLHDVMHPVELCCIYQVHMSGSGVQFHPDLLACAKHFWNLQLSCTKSSEFQQQVVAALHELYGEKVVREEVRVGNDELGMMSMDVMISLKSTTGVRLRLGIEVDGPFHCSLNRVSIGSIGIAASNDKATGKHVLGHYKVLGTTILRNRLLKRRCKAFMVVPWYEWGALGKEEYTTYLKRKIESTLQQFQ